MKILVIVCCFLSLNIFAAEVDLTKSTFQWTGKKITGQHAGKIILKSASLDIKEDKLLGGKFEMDMKSITVEDLEGEWKQKFISHMHSPVGGDLAKERIHTCK